MKVEFLFALESHDGRPLGNIFRDRRGFGIQYLDHRPKRAQTLEQAREKARCWMHSIDRIVEMPQ